jgi:hypothetical protein
VPCSAATFLPLRSAIELIPGRAMISSLPVELSLTSTTVCFAPPLTEESVSFSVWLFASRLPVLSAVSESV